MGGFGLLDVVDPVVVSSGSGIADLLPRISIKVSMGPGGRTYDEVCEDSLGLSGGNS